MSSTSTPWSKWSIISWKAETNRSRLVWLGKAPNRDIPAPTIETCRPSCRRLVDVAISFRLPNEIAGWGLLSRSPALRLWATLARAVNRVALGDSSPKPPESWGLGLRRVPGRVVTAGALDAHPGPAHTRPRRRTTAPRRGTGQRTARPGADRRRPDRRAG